MKVYTVIEGGDFSLKSFSTRELAEDFIEYIRNDEDEGYGGCEEVWLEIDEREVHSEKFW